MQINDEGLRVLANLAQHYDAWVQAQRVIVDGRLQWKTVAGKDYLYRVVDAQGNGRSLGPRGEETEQLHAQYTLARETANSIWSVLLRDGAMYRALRLPKIASYAAEALREIDVRGLLGSDGVLVVGTNALAAYAIEAASTFPSALDATDDLDLTWVKSAATHDFRDPTVFAALKRVDSTYTINTERAFQARNSRGSEIELLLPASLKAALPKHEAFAPMAMPEQDWLLPGERVSHVVCGLDGKPARVVAPDPRWFALHKLWLAEKPQRDPLKKPKDRAQGLALLDLVRGSMPRFPLDAKLREDLPMELGPHLDRWAQMRGVSLGST